MKIRALTNGNEIEADDAAAKQLIDAGIYVPVVSEPTADQDAGQTKSHKPRR